MHAVEVHRSLLADDRGGRFHRRSRSRSGRRGGHDDLPARALDADFAVIFADFQRAQAVLANDLGQFPDLTDVHTHLRSAMTALWPPKPRDTDSAASA